MKPCPVCEEKTDKIICLTCDVYANMTIREMADAMKKKAALKRIMKELEAATEYRIIMW